jgi:hypothetical protein
MSPALRSRHKLLVLTFSSRATSCAVTSNGSVVNGDISFALICSSSKSLLQVIGGKARDAGSFSKVLPYQKNDYRFTNTRHGFGASFPQSIGRIAAPCDEGVHQQYEIPYVRHKRCE